MTTISQALRQSIETLHKTSDTPNLDAQILLASTLDKTRAWVISHPEVRLSDSEKSKYQADIDALARGTPLPYLLGKWEFYGLDFFITPDTLIPRPETEILVEHALEWLGNRPGHHIIADIGTGSGCISIALTKSTPDLTVIASDISLPALKIARKNSKYHQVEGQIHFLQSDLLPPLPIKFDLICANLPYIPAETLTALKIYGHEPDLALNGGEEGLDYITKLLEITREYLNPTGAILLEIDQSQGMKLQSLAKNLYTSADISLHQDLANFDRVLKIQLRSKGF